MKKVKTGLIIAGIIMAVLGGIVLYHAGDGALEGITTVFGWFSIIAAIVSAYLAYKTKIREIRSREILSAFLSAVIGLIFLFSPETGEGTLAIMFAFWMIFASINAMTYGFTGMGIGGFARILYVVLGVFGLMAGFAMLFDWGLSAASFVYFVGIFLIIQGIVSIVSAFSLPEGEE
jgi:Uncharacterized conserved protein